MDRWTENGMLDKIREFKEIFHEIETKDGKAEHRKYTDEVIKKREDRRDRGILEPSKCAAKFILEDIEENELEDVIIADFGCADIVFAGHLNDLLEGKNISKETRISVQGFDFQVIEKQREFRNLTATSKSDVNCGNQDAFTAGSFDYTVSTLALWGAEGSWKDTLKAAIWALKPKGKLILVEWKKYYDEKMFMSTLQDSGLSCEIITWESQEKTEDGQKVEKEKFREKFMALSCKKLKKFDLNKLEANLKNFERKND